MSPFTFGKIQGYIRRTYQRIMFELYGEALFYPVERLVGGAVEVYLARNYQRGPIGGTLRFRNVPKPSNGRSAAIVEARIREHIITAHNLYQLTQ